MKKILFVGFALVISHKNANAMSLSEYLNTVEKNHKSLLGLEVAKEATHFAKVAGDIELVPLLSAEMGVINDKSPLGQFAAFGATETKTNSYSLGFAKKFSSGTGLNFTASALEFDNSGIIDPARAVFKKVGSGSLGLGLSQSLWRDFFGQATLLRQQRQDAAAEAATGNFDLQKKLILVGAESAYWNYILTTENVKLAKASIERAKRIVAWTERRVRDGISDRADLYQIQALLASRQLVLISAEDEQAAATRAVRDFLELSIDQKMPDLSGDISQSRPLSYVVEGKKGKVTTLEAFLAALDAKAKLFEAKEVDDKLKPDLVLSGSYSTNAFASSMSEATQHWTETDRPTSKVGLKFVYPFDFEPRSATREASKKSALVAQLQSERKALESESSWSELNRRYVELGRRIDAAQEISRLQSAAARAQADLFNKGRAVTANVISAEEDAANAELNLTRLRAEQRKMEAQGRLFIVIEEK
jgi:outer membrane protein TolC